VFAFDSLQIVYNKYDVMVLPLAFTAMKVLVFGHRKAHFICYDILHSSWLRGVSCLVVLSVCQT